MIVDLKKLLGKASRFTIAETKHRVCFRNKTKFAAN
jgi:hypothetical protein